MQEKTLKPHVPIIILFFILFSASDIAYACKCGIPTPEVAYSKVNVVFEGRVEAVWPKLILRNDTQYGQYGLYQTYKFLIFRKWKGDVNGNSIEIVSMGAGCDSDFTPGETYLVYSLKDKYRDNQFTSSFCNRTCAASEAMEDYASLGIGQIVSDLTIKFIPETKTHRFFRHIQVYFLVGKWAINVIPISIKQYPTDFFQMSFNLAPYPLLLTHLILCLMLWISLRKSSLRKISGIVWVSLFCLLISIYAMIFLNRFWFVGLWLNLSILLFFSVSRFVKKKTKLALTCFILSICFFVISFLVLVYFIINNPNYGGFRYLLE